MFVSTFAPAFAIFRILVSTFAPAFAIFRIFVSTFAPAFAFINMLLLLGWAPGNNQEIFTEAEVIEAFSIERIGKSGSKFDPDKARWFNQQYLRSTPLPELADLLLPLLSEKGYEVTHEYAQSVAQLMMERAVFVQDMLEGDYLFVAPKAFDQEAVAKRWKVGESGSLMKEWGSVLNGIEEFTVENIDVAFKQFLADKGLGMGAVMPLFRLLLTGTLTGPAAAQVAALIGKEEVMRRIDSGIAQLG